MPVPEANDPALVGEAATSATTVGGRGWGMEDDYLGDGTGTSGDGGAAGDVAGEFSKVVTARRTSMRTTGQLDPLYLLEAVQV